PTERPTRSGRRRMLRSPRARVRPMLERARKRRNPMATIVYAILIVLDYRKTVAGLIAFAQLVVQKMTGNPNFPNAGPLLTSISNAILAYQSAIVSTKT